MILEKMTNLMRITRTGNRHRICTSSVDKLTASKDLKMVCNQWTESCFSRIHKLSQIFSVILVTTASEERSFSVLKRVKTQLMSTSSNKRTTALVLMSKNKGIKINPKVIVGKCMNKYGPGGKDHFKAWDPIAAMGQGSSLPFAMPRALHFSEFGSESSCALDALEEDPS